jgi:hypothetical protein
LAEAAYADFAKFPNNPKGALQDAGNNMTFSTAQATDFLIHIGQLVMNLNGTVRDLVSNVFNYPTLAECYKLAALDCTHQLELRKNL